MRGNSRPKTGEEGGAVHAKGDKKEVSQVDEEDGVF